MSEQELAMQRAMRAYKKQDYEKSRVADAGGGGDSHAMAGPPHWSRPAWDSFRAQYGFYPFSASELPTSFEGCPDWAYEKMNLRRPPITVRPG